MTYQPWFSCGGAWVRTAEPLSLVQNIFHCTPLGSSSDLKLINQKLLLRVTVTQGGAMEGVPAPNDGSSEFQS